MWNKVNFHAEFNIFEYSFLLLDNLQYQVERVQSAQLFI